MGLVGIQLFRFFKPPALVGAFNQDCENIADGSFAALRISQQPSPSSPCVEACLAPHSAIQSIITAAQSVVIIRSNIIETSST